MPRDSYLQQAFELACKNAVKRDDEVPTWYCVLMERYQLYGGPEEGGWWREGSNVVAYDVYPFEFMAHAAAEAVEALAKRMSDECQREYGNHCLRTMEWLDERGLDADFLPEPDGPSEFYVMVCNELPQDYLQSSNWDGD